jgi:hypothetical protein
VGALLTPWDSVSKTRVMSYCRKTNVLRYEYELCHTAITRTSSIKDPGVLFDSKLYFHNHADFIFSECIKLLGLIRYITFRFSSLDCLYVLYFTFVRSKLKYASVVWHSITSADANKPERIQHNFASVWFYRISPHVPYSYVFALEKLNLHSLRKRRHHLDARFLFRSIVTLTLPSWKMLVFVFLLEMLGTSQRLVFLPQINTVLLLGAPMVKRGG